MTEGFPVVMLAAVAVAAYLLIRIPRTLFTEAAGAAPPARLEWGLVAILGLAGAAAYVAFGGHTPYARLAFALAAMVLAGVVYSDFSFLVIPDLYSLIIAILAVLAPWKLPLGEALLGAVLCGGLLGGLAFIWRTLRGADGLGFGDVKLAAALGGLLGAQSGLLAISVSAALVAVLALAARALSRRRKKKANPWAEPEEQPMIPYGAALALGGMAFLTGGLL